MKCFVLIHFLSLRPKVSVSLMHYIIGCYQLFLPWCKAIDSQICAAITLSLLLISMSNNNAAMAKKRPVGYNTHVYLDGVVVKRNADGTVETYEAKPRSERSTYRSLVQQRPTPGLHRLRRKRTPVTPIAKYSAKHSDGVTVKRNPDGTIETFEGSSLSNAQSSPQTTILSDFDDITVKRNRDGTYESHETSQRSLLQGKRSGNSVYRTPDGITVKRNADGTVETYENSGHYSSKVKGHKKH